MSKHLNGFLDEVTTPLVLILPKIKDMLKIRMSN